MKGLLKFFKGYKTESFLAPIFKCLEAIFELLVPLAVARIIDVGINESQPSTIWKMCLVMLALAVIGLICAISAQYFSAKAASESHCFSYQFDGRMSQAAAAIAQSNASIASENIARPRCPRPTTPTRNCFTKNLPFCVGCLHHSRHVR